MNSYTFKKIIELQTFAREKSEDKSGKNTFKKAIAHELDLVIDNFIKATQKSASLTTNAQLFLAVSNIESEKVLNAKQHIIDSIIKLKNEIEALKNKVKKGHGSAETREMIKQAENVVKMLNKEYVQKFEADIQKLKTAIYNPNPPNYIPPQPKLSNETKKELDARNDARKYNSQAEKLMKSQEERLAKLAAEGPPPPNYIPKPPTAQPTSQESIKNSAEPSPKIRR